MQQRIVDVVCSLVQEDFVLRHSLQPSVCKPKKEII